MVILAVDKSLHIYRTVCAEALLLRSAKLLSQNYSRKVHRLSGYLSFV